MKIYKIVNDINDCVYVGQTIKSLEERFKEHCRCGKNYDVYVKDHQSKLYTAMHKYGVEHFSIIQIDTATSREELDAKEKYWIKKLDTINSGYNISPGGDGGPLFKGHHHSDITKALPSSKQKGIPQDPEFALRRCEKNKKKVLCLETKEIFDSKNSAEKCYGSSVGDSIKSGRRCRGKHFIYLSDNTEVTDDFINKELARIAEISNNRRKEAHKKTEKWWSSRSAEELDEIRKRIVTNYKITISNRTEEERTNLSKKLSSIRKGIKFSEEAKRKIGESSKGRNSNKKWYNNGEIQILRYDDKVPEGFVKGMLKNERKINK